MNFDYHMPVRLITGRDCVLQNASELKKLGGSCLIVTSGTAGRKSGALDDMVTALNQAGIEYQVYDKVGQNPLLENCREAGEIARERGAEFIVGIGGGSPLDAAKAAAVYAANDIPLMDIYQMEWETPALPLVLVGTTAGTGSEVSSAAVLTTPQGRKKSVAHPQLFAAIAFGDAKYTYSLSPKFTVSTALDALSHALEGFFSTEATAITDLYAIEAVKLLYIHMRDLRGMTAAADLSDDSREMLYYASVLAGMVLAKCGTCYCHPMGYYLTENYGVPHGTACAVFLSDFVRRARRLMPQRAALMFADGGYSADDLCSLIEDLCNPPNLHFSGDEIQSAAAAAASTKNFTRTAPAGYTQGEAVELLTRLFG